MNFNLTYIIIDIKFYLVFIFQQMKFNSYLCLKNVLSGCISFKNKYFWQVIQPYIILLHTYKQYFW